MKRIINLTVLCLLGIAFATPTIAGKKLSDLYAVDPSNPAVDPAYVKAFTMRYFRDIPVMIAIAECESGFRQYEADGGLLVNPGPNTTASGVYQILYSKHKDAWSAQKDTNITTLAGNLAFARAMYEESGTAPWSSSKACWESKMHQYEERFADATQ